MCVNLSNKITLLGGVALHSWYPRLLYSQLNVQTLTAEQHEFEVTTDYLHTHDIYSTISGPIIEQKFSTPSKRKMAREETKGETEMEGPNQL